MLAYVDHTVMSFGQSPMSRVFRILETTVSQENGSMPSDSSNLKIELTMCEPDWSWEIGDGAIPYSNAMLRHGCMDVYLIVRL